MATHGELVTPLALSVKEACRVTGWGKTSLYRLIGTGEIEAKKFGAKTLISYDSLRRAIENLPPVPVRPKGAASS